jgi:hypothetical protein
LHSFEHDDAAEKWNAISTPILMAHWGQAMTYNHSLYATRIIKSKWSPSTIDSIPEDRVAKHTNWKKIYPVSTSYTEAGIKPNGIASMLVQKDANKIWQWWSDCFL